MSISLVRVVAKFYPEKGGSITHVIELSKVMNSHVEKQLIIAPQCENRYVKIFDDAFSVPIKRVNAIFVNSVRLRGLPGVGFLNLLYYSTNVAREIKEMIKNEYRIDIIQVHYNILGQFLLLCLRLYGLHIPVIILQHGSSVEVINKSFGVSVFQKLSLTMYNWLKPSYYFQLDDGTLNRDFLNELNRRNVRYKVLFHAIDTEYFCPSTVKRSHDKFIILSNHRLDAFKRIDLSIMIFKKFLDNLGYPNDVKMRIVGSGPLLNELKELVETNKLKPYVQFVGETTIEGSKAEMESADVIIGTSLISNVNRSIQEAMACGKPVVIFDSVGGSGLFTNMSNAIVVPAGDICLFAKGIELIYNNPKLKIEIGENARKTIIKYRTWDERIDQELMAYNEVMSEDASRCHSISPRS